MELEEEFDINIPDDAAEKIQTVGQAIEYIEKRSTPSGVVRHDESTCCRHRAWGPSRSLGHQGRRPSGIATLARRERHSSAAPRSTRKSSRSNSAAKSRLGPRARRASHRKEISRIDRFTQFAMVAGIDAVRRLRARLHQGRPFPLRRRSWAPASAGCTKSKSSSRRC